MAAPNPMTPHELRELFHRYFEALGHRRMPGAPIVPPGDPTLLFTSAGMVQFKPYFTGQAEPPSRRMTSVQKCFRTSDIESVGDTSHLTFFEMLGNFGIGDYFKAEIIPWAQEFVLKHLGLPMDRLWPAVFEDDDEAFDLWKAQGYPEERIMRYGEEENYWFSGDVGPCGPDSEIHYDFGEQFGCGPDCHPAHGHDRFVEIWNLVFMTYYCDGQKREPLPQKNIDTGSGFERVMTVLLHNSKGWDKNKLPSVYDTALFRPIISRIEQLSGKTYGTDAATDRAIRIVAEHSRAVTFLVGDERTPVVPSNEERGYVCRRMLRRAVYFGRRHLGIEEPFMAALAETVVDTMKDSYPELERQRQFITEIIGPEEERFDQTLHRGFDVLNSMIAYRRTHGPAWPEAVASGRSVGLDNVGALLEQHGFTGGASIGEELAAESAVHLLSTYADASPKEAKLLKIYVGDWPLTLSGDEAFLLHDTYGFPVDLTRDIAEQHGFTVDLEGFEAEMKRQRERARASVGGADHVASETFYASLVAEATLFTGYQETETQTEIVALVTRTPDVGAELQLGPPVEGSGRGEASAGQDVEIFLAATPFYPEGGGQVGDRGEIIAPHGRIEVTDTQRVAERLIVHQGRVAEGRIAAGDQVTARVDPAHRAATRRNHTATHLLHAALRQVLGNDVRQAGSLVAPDRLRFDFTYSKQVTPEQLAEVESLVNEKVRQDVPVHTKETSFDEAMADGVLAFFGDKYGERVRVVEVNTVVPRFSAELCGGTHCERTGEIGAIIVTGESSIGSGMRRIEALTGEAAAKHIRELERTLDEIAHKLGAPKHAVLQKLESVLAEGEALRKKAEKLERSLASGAGKEDILSNAIDVEGVKVLAARVEAASIDGLRFTADSVRKSLKSGVAVIGAIVDDPDGHGKPMFVALVTPDLVERGLHAGNLLKQVATVAGGNAGGRPDMAQGGGKDPSKLDEALAIVPDAVREMLGI
jgi:alanyl-tRNA synthetase